MMPAPGYVPSSVWWKDTLRRVVGEPNALKRLQWSAIFEALALKPSDVVLDFGCGIGYMTYEIARRAGSAWGIDVADVERNLIPPELKGRLTFVRSPGQGTPFADAMFDVVLMSEVIPMIPDARDFLKEVRRIIKPGGRVVLVNPLDRPGARQLYERNGWPLRLMRAMGKAPQSYEAYTSRLQESFGTALRALPDRAYYQRILTEAGFEVVGESFAPSARAQSWLEQLQFVALCMGWRTYGKHYFATYPLLKVVDRLFPNGRGTGHILVARSGGAQ